MPQGNISPLDRFQMKVAAFGSQSPLERFVVKMKLAGFDLALKEAKNIDPVTENLAEWEDAPKRNVKGKVQTPPSPERLPAKPIALPVITAEEKAELAARQFAAENSLSGRGKKAVTGLGEEVVNPQLAINKSLAKADPFSSGIQNATNKQILSRVKDVRGVSQGSRLLATAVKHNPRVAAALGITAAAGTGLAALSGGKSEAVELPSLVAPAAVQEVNAAPTQYIPEPAAVTPTTVSASPTTVSASPSALSAALSNPALQYGGGAAAGAGIGALLAGKKRRTLGAIGGGVAGAGAVALARYLTKNQ